MGDSSDFTALVKTAAVNMGKRIDMSPKEKVTSVCVCTRVRVCVKRENLENIGQVLLVL